jgi:hypothetical protein
VTRGTGSRWLGIASLLPGLLALMVGVAVAKPKAGAHEPNREYLFATIPWGTPADSALGVLGGRGYHEVPAARTDSTRQAEGQLFGSFALVEASLDDHHRVLRWIVKVLPPAQEARYGETYAAMRKVYDDMVLDARSKHGPRNEVYEKFRFPYERGESRVGEALRNNGVTIRSEWRHRDSGSLTIEMDRTIAVVVTYVSPAWDAVEAVRRGRKAKDL